MDKLDAAGLREIRKRWIGSSRHVLPQDKDDIAALLGLVEEMAGLLRRYVGLAESSADIIDWVDRTEHVHDEARALLRRLEEQE